MDRTKYGKETAEGAQDSAAELVRRAKSGDQEALSDLYEQSYDQVYYTVRSMVRNEDDVFDILQDSYVKAFTHLDSFEGGEKFTAWVRQIAANTARDWMKKTRPMLFSELEEVSGADLPAEEWFEDERADHLPECVIERSETSRLIREILDELPEDQRAAIGMYYYEELSVKEIAAAMNASENAVKSRLLYGRRKIEKKVRELEKKGTKLYGLAPIAFLLWLLRGKKADAAEMPDAELRRRILESLSEPSSAPSGGAVPRAGCSAAHAAGAGGTAKAAAAAGTGLSAAKLAAVIIAAAVVIGGTVLGISKASRKQQPQTVTTPAVSEMSTQAPVPESEAASASETEPESSEEPREETSEEVPVTTEALTEAAETTEEQDALSRWIEAEQAAGRTVLSGTVERIGYDEAVKLQGYPDYNAPDKGQTWIIIRLDAPQLLKGTQDINNWESEYSVVLVWTRRSSGSERGEKILADRIGEAIICSAGSFGKASDTSVPIGFPWAHDIRLPETD